MERRCAQRGCAVARQYVGAYRARGDGDRGRAVARSAGAKDGCRKSFQVHGFNEARVEQGKACVAEEEETGIATLRRRGRGCCRESARCRRALRERRRNHAYALALSLAGKEKGEEKGRTAVAYVADDEEKVPESEREKRHCRRRACQERPKEKGEKEERSVCSRCRGCRGDEEEEEEARERCSCCGDQRRRRSAEEGARSGGANPSFGGARRGARAGGDLRCGASSARGKRQRYRQQRAGRHTEKEEEEARWRHALCRGGHCRGARSKV